MHNSKCSIGFRKLREVYDSYGGQMKLSNVAEAYKKMTNRTLDANKLRKQNGTNPIISYQEFCLLVADNFTADGYEIYNPEGKFEFISVIILIPSGTFVYQLDDSLNNSLKVYCILLFQL